MNRKERRARARQVAKSREGRRAVARALKDAEIPVKDQDYAALRAAGFVVASPRLVSPSAERDP